MMVIILSYENFKDTMKKLILSVFLVIAFTGLLFADGSVLRSQPATPTPAQAAVSNMIKDSHAAIFSAPDHKSALNAMKNLMGRFADMDGIALFLMGSQKTIDSIKAAGVYDRFVDVVKSNVSGMYTRRIRAEKKAQVSIHDKEEKEEDLILKRSLSVVMTAVHTENSGDVAVEWFIDGLGKILDIRVDKGIRMGITLADQYRGVWRESAGDAKKFVATLEERRKGKN